MFSGLVREIGEIKSFRNDILRVRCAHKAQIGDSIAVNGMCLTVIELHSDGFSLEISKHSQNLVALENYKNTVHIEPALRADSRLDGHFVQGHIDCIGVIKSIVPKANATMFEIALPYEKIEMIIPQGSICIDGVSLTIASVGADLHPNQRHAQNAKQEAIFCLSIIPHTLQNTLFCTYKVGRRVNIETDMIVRSIAHILKNKTQDKTQSKAQNSATWSELDSIALRY
ncbi:riboflavin synthase [Helicobacter sp. T3_23-1056]